MSPLPDQTITQPVHQTPFQQVPNVVAAYPTFDDWSRLYSPPASWGGPQYNQALYADMRSGHERSVMAELSRIFTWATGRAVLAEMNADPSLTVRILPFDFAPPDGNRAVTRAHSQGGEAPEGMPRCGARASGKRYCDTDDDDNILYGTGTGSGADIFFTAHHATPFPDETLLHELVHASRKVKALAYRMPISGGYGNQEEFLAMVVQNIYRSEKGRSGMFDYHGAPIDPDSFLDTNLRPPPRTVLALFRDRQPSLYAALLNVNASFNPIRQLDAEYKAALTKADHAA
jgi:hypothetical protein